MSARLHKPFTKPPYFSDIFQEPDIWGIVIDITL